MGVEQVKRRLKWVYSFKLPGVILACNWSFHKHSLEMRRKLAKRLQALWKVSSTARGRKCRISSVTAHAPLKGIVCYGLSTTGPHVGIVELRRIDALFLNQAARRAVGTNITMGMETMLFMADISSAINHYIVTKANV